MPLEIVQFMCLEDNFGVLLHDPVSGRTASIDAPEAAAIERELEARGWKLDEILVTHHHGDHTGGIAALKARYGVVVTGPAAEADKIAGLDRLVKPGDRFDFAGSPIEVIGTPGHTLGQIALYFPQEHAVFAADALFSLGCGRVIEGTMEQMWNSLQGLAALPDDTAVYCGHEYTLSNARFALTIEPENPALLGHAAEAKRLRDAGKPTLPTTIAAEKAANPFLRADHPSVRARMGADGAPAAEVFAAIRRAKDNFR